MSPSFSDVDAKDQMQSHPSLTGLSDSELAWTAAYDIDAAQMNQNASFESSCSGPVAFMGGNGMAYSSLNGYPYSLNYNLAYPSYGPEASCPRSYVHGLNLPTQTSKPNAIEGHPPSAYVIEPPQARDAMDLSGSLPCDQSFPCKTEYQEEYSAHLKVEDCDYDSPYASAPANRSSAPHESLCGMMRRPRDSKGPMPMKDEGPIDKEQPYAQLIYKALLGAPNHTMILRDIYNWFKENTDKAADKETKGWQNSIRHNLSMNGAFEKVDQPCEDSRKGFMWRLTEEAIREGVKSTTRYRSKQPNKRGQRSAHPLPQRQASGSKGGHASKRSARLRRSRGTDAYAAYRSSPYMCSRSVPANYEESLLKPYTVDMGYPHPHPHPHPSSPYALSDHGGFLSPLDHIEELGPHSASPVPSPNFAASPLVGQDAMTQFGGHNPYTGHGLPASAFDSHIQQHVGVHGAGLPYTHTQPYTDDVDHGPISASAYTFPNNHGHVEGGLEPLLYATDDTLSQSSISSSASASRDGSEPRTPEMQVGDAYVSATETFAIDMGDVGPGGFAFQEIGAEYAG